ncbi:hypothetical protein [Streptomyces sp. 5-6(2022)]|uniref:hypothetical protein n=1 Tax=Streptomyces sp. 5-6(2022) TaxID=2936510 RepID=UPI0023B9D0EF|nr:hypothetical protein [Streptomyces sp. 5-6(2022)]
MIHVSYGYSDDCTWEQPVEAEERRGNLRFKLYRGLFRPEGVAALNSTVQQLLAGGQWFQLWRGEIVSMHSPELREFKDGRIHRGPLVDEKAGPRYW